jgi:uncharacterized membrane protein
MKKDYFSIKKMSVTGMLTALTVVLGLSGLGIIQIPGLPFKVTILHIPVIIGAVLEGPVVGGAIGLLFGLWSIVDKVIRPTPTGFVFFNPLVSVMPRILIGIFAYYSYKIFIKYIPENVAMALSSIIGTAINTIGVLGMIYLIYAAEYMETINRQRNRHFGFWPALP